MKGVFMALLKLGPAVAGISGSIGGTTFARNRYGAYARQRTIPVNPQTSRQSAVRTAMSLCRDAWFSTLTAAQRTAWALYAGNVPMVNRLGESINLSGYNQYTRSASAMLNAGLALPTDAPTTFSLPEQDDTLAVSGTADDQKLSVSFNNALAWANETGGKLLIYQGAPQDATVNFFNGPWRYVGSVSGNATTAPTSPQLLDAAFPIAADNRIWIRARILRADGRLSGFFRAQGTVSAS